MADTAATRTQPDRVYTPPGPAPALITVVIDGAEHPIAGAGDEIAAELAARIGGLDTDVDVVAVDPDPDGRGAWLTVRLYAPVSTPADAPDVWSAADAPGGYVCGACGTPTESEPCAEHQGQRVAAMNEDAA